VKGGSDSEPNARENTSPRKRKVLSFTDTLMIKLVPKEHYTKIIDVKSGDLYLTIPVLAQGDSIDIYFSDHSLPGVMKRIFSKEPLFPRFFMFHASCMQGSSINKTIPTHWEGE
jgi:hypothetical protein